MIPIQHSRVPMFNSAKNNYFGLTVGKEYITLMGTKFSHCQSLLTMMSFLHGIRQARLERMVSHGVARHIQYYNAEKLKLVILIDKVMKKDDVKATQAADLVGVSPMSVPRWCKDLQVERLVTRPSSILSFLDDISQDLINFVAQWMGRGMTVSCLVDQPW